MASGDLSDPLSDALGLVRARCVISRGVTEIGRPCTTRFPAERRLRLHVVMRGSCRLLFDGRDPLRLDEGDLAVTNGAESFVLAGDESADSGQPPVVGIAGHIEMYGGYEDGILAALPPVTRIEGSSPVVVGVRYLLDRILGELSHPGPGSEFAREKYSQLILVEVLRVALDAANAPRTGWLRLLADAQLRPALALMHEHPAHTWRLTDLARAVSMSRSTFATRFRALSGEPPVTYLHRWRIHLAQAALRDTDVTVATLAARFGYASESSFSHAFTRTAGVSPRRYRTLHGRIAPARAATT
jgi:AraC-like DNA-binding protein